MCRMSRPWFANAHLGFSCSLSLEYDYVNRTEGIPPISDVGGAIKNIDWDLLKKRSQRDINQIGMVLATTGEFIHDVGVRLADAKF